MLDTEKKEIGYVAGRLCALLEHLCVISRNRNLGMGDVNVDLACRQPSSLLKQFALSHRVIKEFPEFDLLMMEIVSKMDTDLLPKFMPLSDQADFMLAYYKQKAVLKTYRLQIGSRIVEMRKIKGLSQRDLAEAAGVTPANIANIENGKYSVGLDVLYRIATALGCDVGFLDKQTEA